MKFYFFTIFNTMDKLKHINYSEELKEEECPICIDKFSPDKEIYKSDICPHMYHKECIERWVEQKPNCPKCRAEFAPITNVPTSLAFTFGIFMDPDTGSVYSYIPGVGLSMFSNAYEEEDEEENEYEEEDEEENEDDDIDDIYTIYYGSAYTN